MESKVVTQQPQRFDDVARRWNQSSPESGERTKSQQSYKFQETEPTHRPTSSWANDWNHKADFNTETKGWHEEGNRDGKAGTAEIQNYLPTLQEPAHSDNKWATKVGVEANALQGLHQLVGLDELRVYQHVDWCEVCKGCETENTYAIKTSDQQSLFFAAERSGFCVRYCCGTLRPFKMSLQDDQGWAAIHATRPLKCQSCCYPCCLQEMEVTAADGALLGSIEQGWNILFPRYRIKNPAGNVVLTIKGPFWLTSCGCNIDFKIMSGDGSTQIGVISKRWSGFLKELCTKADNFKIKFPANLDVQLKAVILACSLLVDYMYYEGKC